MSQSGSSSSMTTELRKASENQHDVVLGEEQPYGLPEHIIRVLGILKVCFHQKRTDKTQISLRVTGGRVMDLIMDFLGSSLAMTCPLFWLDYDSTFMGGEDPNGTKLHVLSSNDWHKREKDFYQLHFHVPFCVFFLVCLCNFESLVFLCFLLFQKSRYQYLIFKRTFSLPTEFE